jgi:hypothetical protein
MDKRFQLRVAARVAGGADLVEQPHRRQLGIGGEPGLNNRFVGVELRRDGRPRPIADGHGVQISIEIARPNPAVNRVAAEAQPASQRGLTRALLKVMPQEHACLPSDHRASDRIGAAV